MSMSNERLAEIAACSAAADRGPWEVTAGEKKAVFIESPNGDVLAHDVRGSGHLSEDYVWMSDANAALIANAQTYIAELLAEVARLREALTITDEMVERAGKALYRQEFGSGWDEDPTEDEKDEFRELAREVLEAALGGGES